MTEFEAIDVVRVRGTATAITSEERITGLLEYVARPEGGAWLMMPVDVLVAENEKHRSAGIMEIAPLCKMDLHLRVVLSLGKKDAMRALAMNAGDELTLVRCGWGKEWRHRVRRAS